MSRGLPQGAPESPVIFTVVMELILRDLIKSWKVRKLAWSLDDFVLAAIWYATNVVLAATSVAAAEVMVAEVIAKLKEVGLSVGAEKPHWTSHPEDDRRKQCGGWVGCAVGKGVGICGFEGVFGWKRETCDCTQISSSEHMLGQMEKRYE